jgi:hypothetical protein
MPDDDKTKRAAELDAAIKAHDAKKRDDASVDLAKEREGGGTEGTALDKMLSHLDDCMKRMDTFAARMDAFDKQRDDNSKKRDDKHRDDDERRPGESEAEYEERCQREGRSPGEAREPVADSNPAHRAAFADAQTQAEAAYLLWGMRAPGPLFSERLSDYKARLTRPLQKHSKIYAKTDLDHVRDPVAFDEICRTVYADSIAASSAPDSVPRGQLRMIVKRLPSGHTVNEFIGLSVVR